MMLRKILYIFLQWTWGFPQSLMGLILLIALGKQRREWHGFALMTVYDLEKANVKRLGSVSLGMFTFVITDKEGKPYPGHAAHEYGHTFQSLLLGPLYLFAVGIPSSLWALHHRRHSAEYAAKGVGYCSRYPENWAEALGERMS